MKLNIQVSHVLSIFLLATTGFANGRKEEDSSLRGNSMSSSSNREEVVGVAAQGADQVDTLSFSKHEQDFKVVLRDLQEAPVCIEPNCSLDGDGAASIKQIVDFLTTIGDDDAAGEIKLQYCCSPAQNQFLINFTFERALAQGTSFIPCFLTSVLPTLQAGFANQSFDKCPGENDEYLSPQAKIRLSSDPGGDTYKLFTWQTRICANRDICSYTQVNGFLKDIVKIAYVKDLAEYDVIEHYSINKECRDASRMSFRPGPTKETDFCAYFGMCDRFKHVDINLPSPINNLTIAVCTDGCLDTEWFSEEEYLKLLQLYAGASGTVDGMGYDIYESYYCLPESTAHEVTVEFTNEMTNSTEFSFFDECCKCIDYKRQGLCCHEVGIQRCVAGEETTYLECANSNGFPGMTMVPRSLPAGTKCCDVKQFGKERISFVHAAVDCPK